MIRQFFAPKHASSPAANSGSFAKLLTRHVLVARRMLCKEIVISVQSPMLFGQPDTKNNINAALTDVAKVIPGTIDRIAGKWPVRNRSVVPTEDARELANLEFFITKLGVVVVQYVLHSKGDASS